MQYKCVFPDTNSPDGYSSNDLLTFNIPIDADQEVEQGSIYVSGTLHVEKTGSVPVVPADNVQYDAQAGIHGFVRSLVVSVDAGQGDMVIENNATYSRYAKMFYEANQHYITQVVQNSSSMELRCGQDSYTPYVLTGVRNDANNANTGDNSFAFMPLIAVNRTTGNIGGDKIKMIKVQFTLDSVSSIFTNPNAVAGLTFNWKDVKCHYNTQPLQPSQAPLQFFKIINTKTVINSTEVNLTYQPPANVLSVSCSFNKKGNTKLLQTDQLPNVTRVEFSVSGADYTLKFPLKSEEEIVLNYIKSLNSNMMESNAIYANLLGYGYGIGLNYLNPINFQQSRMSINIQSAVTTSDQYTMFTYFTCIDSF